jgi:transcriptional regulator with XRE-family HTH domain
MSQLITHSVFLERLYAAAHTTEQKALAHIANVTSSSMSRIQSGDTMPSVNTLAQIAMVCEVSVDYLIGLTDDPKPPARAQRAAKALNDSLASPIQRGPGKPSARQTRAKRT